MAKPTTTRASAPARATPKTKATAASTANTTPAKRRPTRPELRARKEAAAGAGKKTTARASAPAKAAGAGKTHKSAA